MSAEGADRVKELIAEAGALPREEGSAVPLLEEAVRIADTLGDKVLGYQARMELVDAGLWSGQLERMVVAFAWCLAQYDREPERYSVYSIYWKYKWVAEEVVNFPQLSRAKIEELLEDLGARYTRAGISLRPVHYFRCRWAMVRGDAEEAARHHAAWIAAPRDYHSNCNACEADERVGYHAFRGEDEAAVAQAGPMLSGKLRCAEVPHRTLARVLLPLLRLGRLEEAAEAHRRGIRMLKPGKKLLEFSGEHVAFLALTGNFGRAVKALEKSLPHAIDLRGRLDGLSFLMDTLLVTKLLQDAGTTSVRMRLPKECPAWQKGGRYEVAALEAYLTREVSASAAAFDRRNGTDYTTRRMAESVARASLAKAFSLDRAGD